jgi:hypothetical protein
MQPSSINEPDTSWKRHFEPLLFCIHCLNVGWVARVFLINSNNINNSYYEDKLFVVLYTASLILLIIFWFKYLIKKPVENAVLKKITAQKLTLINSYLYNATPYFLLLLPDPKSIDLKKIEIDSLYFNKNIYYFGQILNFKYFIFILFLMLLLIYSLINRGDFVMLRISILNNWFVHGIFDIFCFGLIMLNLVNFLMFLIYKGMKLWAH